MPITINGNGTVTGIAVGGLPDGIVDTDMIATDAVTNPKIDATIFTSYAIITDKNLKVKVTLLLLLVIGEQLI